MGRDGGMRIMLSLEWLGSGVVEGGVVTALPDLGARGVLVGLTTEPDLFVKKACGHY